jgi:hypothetical protein
MRTPAHISHALYVAVKDTADLLIFRERSSSAMGDSQSLKAKNTETADETRTFEKGQVNIVYVDESPQESSPWSRGGSGRSV